MKLNQNFFWDKFLLIWGIIGMLFPVVVVMRFEVKGLFELLLLGGMSVSCALFDCHYWVEVLFKAALDSPVNKHGCGILYCRSDNDFNCNRR